MKVHGFNPSEQEMTVMIENVDKGRVQNTKKVITKLFTGEGGLESITIFFISSPSLRTRTSQLTLKNLCQ